MKHYEDFSEGVLAEYTVLGLTPDEIRDFARRYDPQRFHLDDEAAAATPFGGLVASGFQTQLCCFRPFCERVLLDTAAVGAPGIDSLRWLRPWYPGEDLDVIVKLTGHRPSSKRPDRGYIACRLTASCDGTPTLEMDWHVIILRRSTTAQV